MDKIKEEFINKKNKEYRFKLYKPKSVLINSIVTVAQDNVEISYYNSRCIYPVNKINNFQFKIKDICSVKISTKLFLSISDLLVYIMIIILPFGLNVFLVNKQLNTIDSELNCLILIFLLFFTFLKLGKVLSIKVLNNKTIYVPIKSFLIGKLDCKDELDELIRILTKN